MATRCTGTPYKNQTDFSYCPADEKTVQVPAMKVLVGKRLKKLRERTIPRLSLRAAAAVLHMPASSYQYYEDDFKDKYLPLDLVKKLAPAFEKRGVPQQELYELAGAGHLFKSAEFSPAPRDSKVIPVIDYVTAGRFGVVADPFPPGAGYEYLTTDLELSEHAFALIIEGDSMAPTFLDGDRVVMDPVVQPVPGDFVVAKLDREGTATFKKYRPRGTDREGRAIFDLVPENPDYPTLRIDADNPGRVIAVMMEHRKRRRPASKT